MYDELIGRLHRYTENCVAYKLDADFASAVQEAADVIEELVRKEKFHTFLWNTIQPNEMEAYLSMYNAGNEKVES